jgi:peroxiredoxin
MHDMKKIIMMLSLAGVLSACIREKITENEVKVGDSLPEFEVTMNDGTVVSDTSLKGEVSIVMFFHISCPDCQQVLPSVQRIYDDYASENLNWALISRECDKDDIEEYWSENGLSMPYSAQNDRGVYNLFASSRIPRIYISDENGIVRYIFTDDPVASYDDLKSALENLIR